MRLMNAVFLPVLAVSVNAGQIDYRQTLDRFCVTCHNATLKTANLVLDAGNADAANPAADPALWEKVLLKLKTRSMPPVGMPRPEEDFYRTFSAYLVNVLDRRAQSDPNPGKTVISHRLNRTEYTNVVRDLLGVSIDGEASLPADNSGGFDNLGDLLSVSLVLMEKYLAVAREVSRLAVGDTHIRAASRQYTISPYLVQNERMNEDLPFGTRGGLAVRHRFPLDGEYEIRVRLLRTDDNGLIIGLGKPHFLDVLLDGKRIELLTVGGENVGPALGPKTDDGIPPDFRQAQYERTADDRLKVRFRTKAGEQRVQVAFLEENFAWEEQIPPREYKNYFTARAVKGYDYERAWMDPLISNITISGPFDAGGPGNTTSREKIFSCLPARPADEPDCAREILSRLVRQGYRRPAGNEDVQPFLDLFHQGSTGGGFEAGIQMAIEGLLVSPEFLFRVSAPPASAVAGSNYALSDIEIASRLSFFLWSSMPDEELLSLAAEGRLGKPAILAQQVQRMLKDERAGNLVNNFAAQWLLLRNLPHIDKNQELFPDFDENLRSDFLQETRLFLASIFRDNRSILDLFRADYKYVNERLARHYGIPDVTGNRFRRVNVNNVNLRGLLAHGSVLAITSYPNRTSPVLRGKWVLENIMAAPPPPPPPNIPALKEQDEGGKVYTMREAIEKHRANPVCAVCHNRMDPIGFGLENFNPIGQWRTRDADQPIDSSGMLPDGSTFQGPAELQQSLLKQSEVIVEAFTRKLLTYAIGRDLEYFDMPAVRQITREAAANDYRFSDLVTGVIASVPFRMRRTDP